MGTDLIDIMLAEVAPAGLICYDAECALCRRSVRRIQRLNRHGFAFVPLQHPVVRARLGTGDHVPDEFKLVRIGRPTLGGATAIVAILQTVPSLRFLAFLANLPVFTKLIDRVYRWIALHRHCHGGQICAVGSAGRAQVRDGIWTSALLTTIADLLGDRW